MNQAVMSGRLTRDPEVRWTTGQVPMAIAKFGLAVDRRTKSKEAVQVDFFNCVAFGRLAEHMGKYWFKGMKALMVGRLENSTWTDKAGNKRVDAQVVLESIEFCEKKDPDRHPAESTAPVSEDGFQQLPDDEGIPFTF